MDTVGFDTYAFASPAAFAPEAAPSDAQLLLKAGFDRALALLALVLLLPLLVFVAALILAETRGPVFFRQARTGLGGETFLIWKFRTMHHAMSDAGALRQTSRHDPRVTRVGRILRRLSIDELPQLLNVLSGDMSLVGPRPHTPTTAVGGRLLGDLVGAYQLRHQVRPGITGWAQVNRSRGELQTVDDVRRRVSLDLAYIENWSILLDLRILFLTVAREIVSPRAF